MLGLVIAGFAAGSVPSFKTVERQASQMIRLGNALLRDNNP
jgi:hypothetical protein